jgi:1,2-diacylglycerol 3-beta-glucosyltransferase
MGRTDLGDDAVTLELSDSPQDWSHGRRRKALIFLVACLGVGAAPHWLGPLRGVVPALGCALVLGGYSLRTLLAGRSPLADRPETDAEGLQDSSPLPSVDVLVAARDEEAVIERLVQSVSAIDYPDDRVTLWIVDDGSQDRTGRLLDELTQRHPRLQVRHRPRDAGGGKSGALNALLPHLHGDWLMVLDADASVPPDLLQRLRPWLAGSDWDGLQLRKAVVHPEASLLTRAQALEMAFDAEIQQGRIAQAGVGELRGNGQLLRRTAVRACGGFNEDTVTDDLDLSIRFLLEGHPVLVLWDPPVLEEPVTRWSALLRQRQRWAEGGLQRYFDYWPALLFTAPLSRRQRLDVVLFFLIQYVLPVASFGDLLGALGWRQSPLLWPLSLSTLTLSALALVRAGRRSSEGPALPAPTLPTVLLVNLYLLHWFLVIPWVSLRMATRPKRLVWAKTVHAGLPVTTG